VDGRSAYSHAGAAHRPAADRNTVADGHARASDGYASAAGGADARSAAR